ncbi:bifunctional DedA family/phosphatase PAP2 family protein [Loktanella salsilacus]|uniref:bifunctional DedA family/phosphatase PAP2 family protein n=1 Tax=Loktanella salsilacus TaxID=195913 RepID=UPI0020B73979|nr:bifunctional DedA family/phosphatase PAP2 family protein [Loktanella salsilacus]UTH43913.1 phosphatase PAP2 family protein [Loktanella salsilacus]
MPYALDLILPSASAFGSWTYWLLVLIALLEGFVLTGILVPGTVIIVAAGMLAQRGVIDFATLVWCVALGSFVGHQISYVVGRFAATALRERHGFSASRYGGRASGVLRRHGPAAMLRARFMGPVAGFVPFAGGAAGLRARRFTGWNALGALPYALIVPALGYGFGALIGTLTATAPRIAVFAVIVTAALIVLGVILRRLRLAFPALRSVAVAVVRAVQNLPRVRAFLARHPQTFAQIQALIAARFGTDQFLGLTATVLGVLLVYVGFAYADSVFDFLGDQSTVSADTRIANLLYAMRDDRLIVVLGWITDLGGRHGLLPLLAGATLAMLALRRYNLLGGLWIAAVGNQLTVTLLKSFFDRPRSDLGYFVETSGSFPSGHAAGAVAVWAMLFYLAWRLRLLPLNIAALAAVLTAFAIGVSRVYLVEHYLSDVLNGYLVGALWLILGIAFCEWRRPMPRASAGPLRKGAAAVCFAVSALVAVYAATAMSNPLNQIADRTTQVMDDPAAWASTDLPQMTELLSGAPRQALNLIIVAPDIAAITQALGPDWQAAPRPSVPVLAAAVFDDWTGRALPDPLVIPTFWDNRPSTMGYTQPAPVDDLRLHLRIWDSLYRTPDSEVIYAATITQEHPLDWADAEDAIAPLGSDVPASVDAVIAALNAAGLRGLRP